MKKIIIKSLSLFILITALSQFTAAAVPTRNTKARAAKTESEETKDSDFEYTEYVKESKVEIRSRLSKNASENSNGDVDITVPAIGEIKNLNNSQLPKAFGRYIRYALPSLDTEEMYKAIPPLKEPRIDILMAAADKYLSSKNLSVKAMSYSQSSIISLIDDGLPVFIFLKDDKAAFDRISKRNENRPVGSAKSTKTSSKTSSNKNSNKSNSKTKNNKNSKSDSSDNSPNQAFKEWIKFLQKTSIKRFNGDAKSGEGIYAIITGYNKTSKEFKLVSEDFGTLWMTEAELKLASIRMFQFRF